MTVIYSNESTDKCYLYLLRKLSKKRHHTNTEKLQNIGKGAEFSSAESPSYDSSSLRNFVNCPVHVLIVLQKQSKKKNMQSQ